MWERACSRWRRHLQHECKLTHRYREQARSHRLCIKHSTRYQSVAASAPTLNCNAANRAYSALLATSSW
nr:hypothetical protein C1892_11970 [Pseudomonas sp. MPBD7-1]